MIPPEVGVMLDDLIEAGCPEDEADRLAWKFYRIFRPEHLDTEPYGFEA